jgi:hypothetical protein
MKQHHEPSTEFAEPTHDGHTLSNLNCPRDGGYNAFKLGDLNLELLSAEWGETVITRPAIPRRYPPFRRDPAFNEHALERGVERAFLNLQNLIGNLLNPACDLIPVQFSMARKGL